VSGQVTISKIQELRKRTGVGMNKCKQALAETGADLDEAVKLLRKQGLASASKKEGRETKEGAIGVAHTDGVVALVEVNAETDFVVKNDGFQDFLSAIAAEIAATRPKSIEEFEKQTFSGDTSLTIAEYRATVIQKMGENVQLRRIATFDKAADHSIGTYSHMGGSIVTLVDLKGANNQVELAGEIAMHVAAGRPDYLSPEAVPAEIIQQEREIAAEQVKGKPENIIEKILEGKLRAFYDQVCLTKQKFVRDDKVSIEQLVAARAKESDCSLELSGFTYWKVGG
jgi:elongation factor Ts